MQDVLEGSRDESEETNESAAQANDNEVTMEMTANYSTIMMSETEAENTADLDISSASRKEITEEIENDEADMQEVTMDITANIGQILGALNIKELRDCLVLPCCCVLPRSICCPLFPSSYLSLHAMI